MRYDAVLFDLDGTLTTSINAFVDGETESFARVGVEVTREDIVILHKIGVREGIGRLLSRVPQERRDELNGIRQQLIHQYLEERTQLYEDTETSLETLRSHRIPSGVVTSARYSHILAMNVKTRIKNLIPILATGDCVGGRYKPDPYGLDIGCTKLQLHPKQCLYVGDAAFDMLAAKNIGMDGCLVERPHMNDQELNDALEHATHHIHSLNQLPDILNITNGR